MKIDSLEVLKIQAIALQEEFLRNRGPKETLDEYNASWEEAKSNLLKAALHYGRGKTEHDGLWNPPEVVQRKGM